MTPGVKTTSPLLTTVCRVSALAAAPALLRLVTKLMDHGKERRARAEEYIEPYR